jgi:hypothetical protein
LTPSSAESGHHGKDPRKISSASGALANVGGPVSCECVGTEEDRRVRRQQGGVGWSEPASAGFDALNPSPVRPIKEELDRAHRERSHSSPPQTNSEVQCESASATFGATTPSHPFASIEGHAELLAEASSYVEEMLRDRVSTARGGVAERTHTSSLSSERVSVSTRANSKPPAVRPSDGTPGARALAGSKVGWSLERLKRQSLSSTCVDATNARASAFESRSHAEGMYEKILRSGR